MTEATLHTLRTNAARLGARLGENLAEHSRDLGLIDSFASGSGGGSGKYLESGVVVTAAGIEETKKMLASKRESDRLEGLKRVIAMMTKNLPVTAFFPLVTSLLSPSTPLQARTLISLYIVHCAATAPELALLSINAYQKDLSDPNPIVRAGAIKTLSAMNLDDIRSLVGMAVTRAARDGSWYVRRAAADAIVALWRADPTIDNRQLLSPTLVVLLDTAGPLTIGSALSAWEELRAGASDDWTCVHRNYRRWCKMLMDVEEWGQCVVMRVLVRYGRTFFLDPAKRGGHVDPDAELLLKSSEALLQHLNPAVVSAAIKVHYYLGPADRLQKVIRPLLRLLKTASPEVQAVVLDDCAVIADDRPDLLVGHLSDFFVRFSATPASKVARLRILVALANESNIQTLLQELMIYVQASEDAFSACAIAAIGTCAQRVPSVTAECLKTLIKLAQGENDAIIAQSVLVLRSLLSSPNLPPSTSRVAIITRLVELLQAGKITAPTARATVYWLVGQYAGEGLLDTVGPDTVRLGAKGFADESNSSKLQLVTLSAKLLVLAHAAAASPHLRILSQLFDYITALARYDLTYEVRDRARFLKGLVAAAQIGQGHANAKLALAEDDFKRGVMVEDLTGGGDANGMDDERTMTSDQVRSVLFEGKVPSGVEARESEQGELGTLSLSLPSKRLLFGGKSSASLPPYPTAVPPASIRDAVVSSSPSGIDTAPARTTPMRGFGSDDLARQHSGSSGRATPVVLVPTNFATGGGSASADGSRSASPNALAGANGRKTGFRDLEDFYADEDESEEESEEGDSEEEEEDEVDDDEDDNNGEGSSGEDESSEAASEESG